MERYQESQEEGGEGSGGENVWQMKREVETIKDEKKQQCKGAVVRRKPEDGEKMKSRRMKERMEGTSVAMLWLAPFSRRKRTTSR